MRTRYDREVLDRLEDRHREPPAGLARVVHAEPLMGRVPATRDHELWAQQPAQGPAREEDRKDQVERAAERQFGTPAPGEDDADRHGEEQAAERGEATVPDGEDVAGVVRVVAQVREDVHGPGPDHRRQDDPEEHGDEPVGAVAVVTQATLEVGEPEPEREREADAIGVDLQGPDVEFDGDRSHGAVGARLRPQHGVVDPGLAIGGGAGRAARAGRRPRSRHPGAGR